MVIYKYITVVRALINKIYCCDTCYKVSYIKNTVLNKTGNSSIQNYSFKSELLGKQSGFISTIIFIYEKKPMLPNAITYL